MGDRRLLNTTDGFDNMIDGATSEIWQTLKKDTLDPSTSFTEYLYQDFSYDGSANLNDKQKIMQITFIKQDFIDQGITSSMTNFGKFFIKSKMYAKLARNRTLCYFNKITLQT